jgi:hypothetical protein
MGGVEWVCDEGGGCVTGGVVRGDTGGRMNTWS